MPKKITKSTNVKSPVKLKKDKKVKKSASLIVDLNAEVPFEQEGKVTLVTKEGFDALVQELNDLKTKRRKEVAGRIKEAISFGDLSENSEYAEAKDEQAFVEGRIIDLERMIKNAKIISEKEKEKNETVQLGTTVKVKNLTKGEFETYTIVGSTEANPFENKISNESPVGSSLLDKQKGDKVKVHIPAGSVDYQIVSLD